MRAKVRFCVDISSPIAVYVQIENQIKFAITSGKIKKGQSLPSVKEMAKTLDVNPNTVTKAYRDLALLGFVNSRRGIGVKVTDNALKLCRVSTRKMVKSHLKDAVGECLAAGLNRTEVSKVVAQAVRAKYRPYSSGN